MARRAWRSGTEQDHRADRAATGAGYELRRPRADTLRDGIHELRIVSQHVNYRVLYFFHGRTAVLSHGITKEGLVPPKEIDRGITHRQRFVADPAKHTYTED